MVWTFLSKYWLVVWFSLQWVACVVAFIKASQNDQAPLAFYFRSSAQRYLILIMLAFVLTKLTK